MNIKSFTILLAVFAPVIVFSQQKHTKRAEKEYEKFNYSGAAEVYTGHENLLIEDERKLAESLWRMRDFSNAEIHYANICNSAGSRSNDFWNYAQILMGNGKYAEAKNAIDKFHQMNQKDGRGNEYATANNFVESLRAKENNYSIKNLNINTVDEDFGVAYYNDKVVFASTREGVSPIIRKWNGNQLHFLDLFVADKGATGELNNLVPFRNGKANRKFHDGPVAFNTNCTKMALTRSNYDIKSKSGINNFQIYIYEFKDGKWGSPVDMPFNNPEYSVGHATFTPDGNTIYFASDMPGGKGGSDIYKTSLVNGSWSTPENIAEINSEGDEMFPHYHQNDILFFASNGHVGLGGLDIYFTQIKNGKAGKIENLGFPMNDNRDDFALVLDKDMKSGYFSSNRLGGKGDDDIYSFSLLAPLNMSKKIEGITKDKNGAPIPGVLVNLYNAEMKSIDTVKSDQNGFYAFDVERAEKYTLTGNEDKYIEGKASVNMGADDDIINVDLELEKEKEMTFSLYTLVTDKSTGKPLEGAKLTLMDNFRNTQETIITGQSGDNLKQLIDVKLNDKISYNLIIEKQGYLSKTVTYDQLIDHNGKYEVSQSLDISLEKMEVGRDLAKLIDIKPIFFDLGKYNIRKDAAIELDKIVKIMNENPTLEVELGSHTDCRSSASSNLILSEQRAKASAEYIKQKITSPERITSKGYGETILLNDCGCEGNVKSKCSEAEHQMNRRTEFKIVKM
jgi:outer membrane protein OmpA-like peptidoglycan-associated protein